LSLPKFFEVLGSEDMRLLNQSPQYMARDCGRRYNIDAKNHRAMSALINLSYRP
jgi:hypothetical protein